MININNPKHKPLHREAYMYRAYGGTRAKSADTSATYPKYYQDRNKMDLLSSRPFQGGVAPSKVTSPRRGKSFMRNEVSRPNYDCTGIRKSNEHTNNTITHRVKKYYRAGALPCKAISGQSSHGANRRSARAKAPFEPRTSFYLAT